jgi:hypothetical protein
VSAAALALLGSAGVPVSVRAAGPTPDGATGYDVGWPQCAGSSSSQAGPLPPNGSGVAIVEVNDGHPWNAGPGGSSNTANFAGNPCIDAEWAWARTSPNPPSAYVIVNYPNVDAGNQGVDPYMYGQQTATAAMAYAAKHGVSPAMWWLDVETGECWDTACDNNFETVGAARSIQGSIDYLHSKEQIVGVYSTSLQWGMITGGATFNVPVWNADYNDPRSQAYLGCTNDKAFNGGGIWLVQSNPSSTGGQFDPDYSCPAQHGYYLVAGDGGIFPFGDAIGYGSTGNIRLNQPVVGMAATPDGKGYWVVCGDGGIFPFGNAPGYGSTGNIRLNKPIVGMASTPDGHGYWLVASDGGIFPFGNAGGYGSTGNIKLNQPIVGMAPTPDGRGYWLVASDGGIFPFGDAVGYGSTGGIRLNQPIVGMAAAHDGHGYWLVAADGGIFPFGPSAYGYGSAGNMKLESAVVGMAVTHDGGGYWLVTARGAVLPFGDADSQAYGNTLGVALNKPILGLAPTS